MPPARSGRSDKNVWIVHSADEVVALGQSEPLRPASDPAPISSRSGASRWPARRSAAPPGGAPGDVSVVSAGRTDNSVGRDRSWPGFPPCELRA